ncbi:MAG TPA: hypothetical protein VFT64_10265 [Rickettsiales bacterium]|nr:hypothetical protein [Rickettsiales bacterium]
MLPTIRYIFLTAWRDKMFWVLLAGILAAGVIAHMLGATAPDNTRELTAVYSSNAARVMIIIGLIVFVCSHLQHAFETREVDVFLSRPLTRTKLILAYWVGFANVALIHAAAVVLLLGMQDVVNWKGFLLWSGSLLLECWLVVAIALFASFTLKSSVSAVLASMGFYMLARIMAFFVVTTQTTFLFQQQWLNAIVVYILKGISMIMPRLDFFAKDEWLTAGVHHAADLQLFVGQAAIFIPLLILATVADFNRKQF